jgi:hypothetical protein
VFISAVLKSSYAVFTLFKDATTVGWIAQCALLRLNAWRMFCNWNWIIVKVARWSFITLPSALTSR